MITLSSIKRSPKEITYQHEEYLPGSPRMPRKYNVSFATNIFYNGHRFVQKISEFVASYLPLQYFLCAFWGVAIC